MEESEDEILRNMKSIGIDLRKAIEKGYLKIIANRPTHFSLERHIITFQKEIEEFDPNVVILDPISSLVHIGHELEVHSMLTRIIDFLKTRQATCLLTYLAYEPNTETTILGISSIIDTWILLCNAEKEGRRSRNITIIKSRGMNHSNRISSFIMTERGIEISEK